MLRIKRSVQAQFSTQVNFVSVQMLAAAAGQEAGNKAGYISIALWLYTDAYRTLSNTLNRIITLY